MQILQFKAPYLYSEITTEIRNQMAMAISTIINVNASRLFLSFVDASLRRRRLLQQQQGVLVSVFLKDGKDSVSEFTSLLTQERLNTQMASLGLRSIQLLSSSIQTTSLNSANTVSGALIGGIIGGVVGGGLLCTLIFCTVQQRIVKPASARRRVFNDVEPRPTPISLQANPSERSSKILLVCVTESLMFHSEYLLCFLLLTPFCAISISLAPTVSVYPNFCSCQHCFV